MGVGCYAVTASGRRRWTIFPDIVADDKFVRLHFAPSERRVATGAEFTVFMPEGLHELVRIRSRWIRANAQLSRRFPELARGDKRRFAGLVSFLVTSPDVWAYVPVFLLAYALAELRALRPIRGSTEEWERADRSRACRSQELLQIP